MPGLLRFLPRLGWLLAAAVLILAGCQRAAEEAPVTGGDSPTASARLLIDDLRVADLVAFWKHGLPPADFAALVERYKQDVAARTTSDAAREDYRQFMRSLTKPDAEAELARRLRVQAIRIDSRYGDQLPVLIAIGSGVFSRIVATDLALRPPQQQGLRDALAPLTAWAQRAPWLDRQRTDQAAAVAVDTARALQLHTLDQLQALDFPTAMVKASQVWSGLKQVLALYGFSLDATLASAKVTLLSRSGPLAHVQIRYLVQGQPQQIVLKMRQVDGRWYPDALPPIARMIRPPEWNHWWEPTVPRAGAILPHRDAHASPVQ